MEIAIKPCVHYKLYFIGMLNNKNMRAHKKVYRYRKGQLVYLWRLPEDMLVGSSLNINSWPIPCIVEILAVPTKHDPRYRAKLVNGFGDKTTSMVEEKYLCTLFQIRKGKVSYK